jgi:integrase
MANYLWKSRHGTYYFRWRIAREYRYYFDHKTELRRSLQTTDRASAKRAARAIMAALDRKLEQIDYMTKKQPQPGHPTSGYTVTMTEERDSTGVFKLSKTLDMSPKEHEELGDERVKSIVAGMGSQTPSTTVANVQTKNTCPKVTDILDDFVKFKSWTTPKTEAQYRATVKILVGIIGDKPFNEINKADARAFRDSLSLIPLNMHQVHSPYRKMTIKQAIAARADKTLSPTSVKHQIVRVKALFNWIEGNYDELTVNPFAKMQAPTVDKSNARDSISNEDIAKIFSCYIYNDEDWPKRKKGKEPSKFWIPLILAFTGCRLNEACQLYLDDISKKDDVWVINFNESRDDQSLKGSFARNVPLHKVLINAGLPDFVEQQREAGHTRLFPELVYTHSGNRYSRATSEFCIALFKSAGAEGTPHSFRHSVVQGLTHADVELRKAQYIVGHKGQQSVTEEVYGANKFTMRQLKAVINKLDYGFDFGLVTYARHSIRTGK